MPEATFYLSRFSFLLQICLTFFEAGKKIFITIKQGGFLHNGPN